MSELVVTRTPDVIAAEIRSIDAQVRSFALKGAVEIGQRLCEAKAQVAHGEWGKWLKQSVSYSQSTAQNFMNLYEEYHDKIPTLGDLSYTKALALLAVPEEEREQFIQENDVESLSARKIQDLIKEKKAAEDQAKAAEERARKAEDEAEKVAESARQAREALAKLEEQSRGQMDEVKRLQAQLEDAAANGTDEEFLQAKRDLEDAKRKSEEHLLRIEQLEEELRAKPIEATVTEFKVPEEVETELEGLRQKVAKMGSSQAEIKFRLLYGDLVGKFKDLIALIDEIPEDQREKYKGAVTKTIAKMGEKLS